MMPVLVSMMAAVALGAAAGVASAADGVAYGGSTYRAPGHGDSLLTPVALVRQADGRLEARIDTGYTCARARGSNLDVQLSGAVGANGEAFVLRRTRRLHGGGRMRVTLRGRVTATDARGTLHTRVLGLGRCLTTTRKFLLRPGGLAAGPVALPSSGAILAGTTTQSIRGIALPVAIRAGHGGRSVTALWEALLQCGPDDTIVRANFSPRSAVHADGTFVRRERYTRRYRDGMVERDTVVFAGQVVAGGAVGTLRIHVTAHRGRTRFVPCDSGTVSWSARG